MSNEAIDALLAEASRLYNDGQYRQAIQKWEQVLAADPANQKATESIRIASLLSDTWTEGGEMAPAADAATPAPSPEQQQLEEGIAQVKELLASRSFQEALSQCESLAALAPDSAEVKGLTDQARSGLESEPFIRAAMARAEKELKAGNFDTVEVLCRKVISLDANNREARTFLYMAQRRTSGGAEAAPDTGTAEAAPEFADAAPADPMAAFGADMGDLSPMDLGGGEAGADELIAPPGGDATGTMVMPAFERGEEVDASRIESIPLVQTRKGGELVREGSIYANAGEEPAEEPSEQAGAAEPAAAAIRVAPPVAALSDAPATDGLSLADIDLGDFPAPPAPEPRAPAGPMKPGAGAARAPAAGAAAAKAAAAKGAASKAGDEQGKAAPEKAARPHKAGAPAARVSARTEGAGGGRWIKIAALLVVLIGGAAGAAFWWINRPMKMEPLSAPPLSKPAKPNVTAVSGPGGDAAAGAAAGLAGSVTGAAGAAVGAPDGAAGAPNPAVGAATGGAAAPGVAVDAAGSAAAASDGAAGAPGSAAEPALPSDPAARQAMAQKMFADAKRQMNAGNLAKARELLNTVVELDAVMFDARDLLEDLDKQLAEEKRFDTDVQTVITSFESGDYRSALWKMYRLQESFPEVRSWDANIGATWYNWGVLTLKAGNPKEASEKFNEVLLVLPQDREASRQLAVAERYLSRPKDQAFYTYVEALNMRPLAPMRRR